MPPQRQDSRRRSPSDQNTTRREGVRSGLQQLFTGRSSVGTSSAAPVREVREEILSPKTPILAFREHELPSTHIRIPGLTRSGTFSSNRSSRSSDASPRNSQRLAGASDTPVSTRPIIPNVLQRTFTNRPAPAYYEGHVRNNSRFVGVDPAEAELAELAQAGRRRRRKTRPSRTRMFAPKIKNRKIRAKILSSFVSGIFLTLMLTIYLAMSLSNRKESQEFHVLLILIILVTTIFFCHALIRLCMMLINPPADDDERPMLPSMVGPGGFAEPSMPIRVALARDEEAAGIESEATKVPPPAYGLWRESVRVDPNRIFWQRNHERQASTIPEERPATGNRPPSYLSDDGIDYVIEAEPRSIAPTTNVPLPPHPSERERWPRS